MGAANLAAAVVHGEEEVTDAEIVEDSTDEEKPADE
jgi:hypothetical protein